MVSATPSAATPARETTATVVFVRGQAQALKAALEEEIRCLAYQKWEAAGKPIGDGVSFWLDAEQEIVHGECVTA
jgi:hypothetical protein